MTLDRLVEQPFPSDALDEHLPRNLALAEARDLHSPREVGGRVLDSMLNVVARNLDGETNLAVPELFELSLHQKAIRANLLRARVRACGCSCSPATPKRR